MGGIWPTEGVTEILGVFFKGVTVPTLYLGLYSYSGNYPNVALTLADLQEPGDGGLTTGYARIALTTGDFTQVDGQVTAAVQTFTAGANWGSVDGWFLTDCASGTAGKLLVIEQFSDGPYIVNNGGTVNPIAAVGGA